MGGRRARDPGGRLQCPHPEAVGFEWAGGHHVDHVLVRGFHTNGPGVRPARGALSDHEPVLVELSGPDG